MKRRAFFKIICGLAASIMSPSYIEQTKASKLLKNDNGGALRQYNLFLFPNNGDRYNIAARGFLLFLKPKLNDF